MGPFFCGMEAANPIESISYGNVGAFTFNAL